MQRSNPARSILPSLIAACLLGAGSLAAQGAPDEVGLIVPDDAEWTEVVPGIDFGALFGDWTAEEHGKLVRFDPGVISPMHSHSAGYHAVVISGTVVNPYEDEENPPHMEPGTYWSTPAGAVHATGCVSEEPCLIYAHMDTLWDFEAAEGVEED